MSFCDAALADVSSTGRARTPNANVIHEVGLAQGILHRVAFIRRKGSQNMPSNLGGVMVAEYDPGSPRWPREYVRGISRLAPLFFTGRPPSDYGWLRRRGLRGVGKRPGRSGRRPIA